MCYISKLYFISGKINIHVFDFVLINALQRALGYSGNSKAGCNVSADFIHLKLFVYFFSFNFCHFIYSFLANCTVFLMRMRWLFHSHFSFFVCVHTVSLVQLKMHKTPFLRTPA